MSRSLSSALVGGVLLLALQAPAWAETTQVGTAVEAWYRGSLVAEDGPFCILPCPQIPAPETPHPENTLHVGVSGGSEVARTYFELDLSGLPSEADVSGGSVRLPVAGPDAGTMAPELADVVACAVAGDVRPADGGPPDEAPAVDCSTDAPLEFDESGMFLTFDLGPFLTGEVVGARIPVGVVASQSAREEQQSWRVVFHGRERDTEDAEPITAEIEYTVPSSPGPAGSGPVADRTPEPSSGDTGVGTFPERGASAPSFEAGADEPAAAPPPLPSSAPRATAPPGNQPSTALPGAVPIAYPQVWLLPLLFVAVGAALVKSLSADYRVDTSLAG